MVGSDNSGYERSMGIHGLGSQNENGERLCEFCEINGLVITGTLFPHKDIHKATWTSANGRVCNQIDHLLISGQWRSSVLDTRVQRGADVNSDHYLVKTRIKLRLSRHKKKGIVKPRLDVERLKDEKTRKAFSETLRRKLDDNREETDDIEQVWETTKKSLHADRRKRCLASGKGRVNPGSVRKPGN